MTSPCVLWACCPCFLLRYEEEEQVRKEQEAKLKQEEEKRAAESAFWAQENQSTARCCMSCRSWPSTEHTAAY